MQEKQISKVKKELANLFILLKKRKKEEVKINKYNIIFIYRKTNYLLLKKMKK